MGKVGNGVNGGGGGGGGNEEEQALGTSDENGEQNVERRFCCFGCKGTTISRFIGFRCVFVLVLSVAVFLSAVFWLPPFLQFADQGDLDLDYRYKGTDDELQFHFFFVFLNLF